MLLPVQAFFRPIFRSFVVSSWKKTQNFDSVHWAFISRVYLHLWSDLCEKRLRNEYYEFKVNSMRREKKNCVVSLGH